MKKYIFLSVVISFVACKEDPDLTANGDGHGHTHIKIEAEGFPTVKVPADNQTTVEGIELGRMLFYDPILSGDSTQSCASCHAQDFGFSDNGLQFSEGISGDLGNRNAPGLTNAAWLTSLFWDGRSGTLEDQAKGPVENPIEMNASWTDVIDKLKMSSLYTEKFTEAFGNEEISQKSTTQAIAQFERSLISNNSKYDQYLRGEYSLTDSENRGLNLFFSEVAECFHCHGTVLFTDNDFHDIGLDSIYTDNGLGDISGKSVDNGKFKTPTLRNVAFSAPYMHDGRFNTLDEVLEFYSEGVSQSPNVDPLIRNPHLGGFALTQFQRDDLVSFLKTLSDASFLNNPDFKSPF